MFILGQPTLRHRGAEDADYLVAGDSVRYVQALTAFHVCCYLVSRSCHHGTSCYPSVPGADRGGSWPPERFAGREATSMNTPRSQKRRQTTAVKMTISATVVWGPPGRSRNATMPGRNIAYSIRKAIFVARHGSRGDLAPVSSAGMSAVASASSA